MTKDKVELFETMPVGKAVMYLAFPTVITQLIVVAYNMADTFFIGQTGDPNQVAAASICVPIFMINTCASNLFGIGGASLISRSLGEGNFEKAKKTSAFSIWSALIFAFIFSMLLIFKTDDITKLAGADEDTLAFCRDYAFWTVGIGSIPTLMNSLLSHLVRAEGYVKQASFGVSLGCILNIILDPIFITVLGMEIKGAAIATMLSNCIATLFFLIFIFMNRSKLNITFNPKYYSLKDGIPKEVCLVGLPSFFMNLMAISANIVLNKLMVLYSNEAVAGVGIAKKVDSLMFAVANGIAQGTLPLIGYNFSAKNKARMKEAIKKTFILCFGVTFVGALTLFICAGPIIKAFIDDPITIEYGRKFQRIICCMGPCTAVTMVSITTFQAIGEKLKPMILTLLRKGCVDIPAMIILNSLVGVMGIAWGIPIADFAAMAVSLIFFIPFWKNIKE